MQHLVKTWIHVLAAALLAMAFGIGFTPSAGVILGLLSAAVFSAGMLAGGLGSTIFARSALGLAQVGKLLQLGMFFFSGALAAFLTALLLPFAATYGSVFCLSATTIIGYIAIANISGQIKQYSNRSWLPVRMPRGDK